MSPPSVSLRAVEATDLDHFFTHQRDPLARRMAAFTSADGDDRPAFDAHWARIRADGSNVNRTIESDGAVVGHVAAFEQFGACEVTYWIDRLHWGRGIATLALRLLLAELPARPLHARAAADNHASIAVLERCGFVVCRHDRGFAAARGAEIDEGGAAARSLSAATIVATGVSTGSGCHRSRACRVSGSWMWTRRRCATPAVSCSRSR